ncbi:MAG: four helix bundle protein [Deltaproteobacteria bacterium]|nr:four helix bundle protein [Deltaproteobacteria bacterium]
MTASIERLDCFRVARDFARLAQRLPIANAVVRDQFHRASLSVLTNVAEGAGRIAKADKRRCYAIARGEACECAALLDLIDDASGELGNLLSRVIDVYPYRRESASRPRFATRPASDFEEAGLVTQRRLAIAFRDVENGAGYGTSKLIFERTILATNNCEHWREPMRELKRDVESNEAMH